MCDFPEDVERLPEGFKRIAYDSDSSKFTFRDRNGHLYQGEAGADYGILTPMSASTNALSCSRPNAFSSDSSSTPPPTRCKTFEEFLPSDFITTTSSLSKKSLNPKTPTTPKRLVYTVRKTLLPKMQDVLRRSITSIRRTRPTFPDEMRNPERDETRGLVRRGSSSDSSVDSDSRRSKTIASRSKYPS